MKPKHLLILIPLLFAIHFLCSPLMPSLVFAEEPAAAAPAETKAEAPAPEKEAEKPAEDPKEEEASKLWNPSLWEIVGAIIALIWGIIVAKLKLKEGKKKKITMAFEAAVQDTYTELVRDLKIKKGDGKLTKEEVKEAQAKAWDKAKEILKDQGINLGKEMMVEYGPVIVTKIVQLFKKKKD
jgi:pyruvate/2-oxoglutarate dehydrogenase complex dihydrolipoamide acyltransferase (E2) component